MDRYFSRPHAKTRTDIVLKVKRVRRPKCELVPEKLKWRMTSVRVQ
jgi:hypothetical protein